MFNNQPWIAAFAYFCGVDTPTMVISKLPTSHQQVQKMAENVAFLSYELVKPKPAKLAKFQAQR